jgi:exosortase
MVAEALPAQNTDARRLWAAHWPLIVGFLVLAIPTLMNLVQQVWSTEAGAQGPIVLFTGVWLVWRKIPDLTRDAKPGSRWMSAILLVIALALYVFGRAYDYISIEVAGLYGVALTFLFAHIGLRPMTRDWFPFLYLGFLIPPPGWLIDQATAPLKTFVSYASTELLQICGLPIAREGVTLFIGQYQMLVEDACSGMKSLSGLIAISLFYIYLLRNASWRYSLLLTALVIPIAVVANILRIITLILLTYFMGDAVGQGFLHKTAGLFLFATALALVFAIDHAITAILQKRKAAQ